MRVGIMGRSLRDQQAGVGRYTANLVRALAAYPDGADMVVFLTRAAAEVPAGAYRRVFAPMSTPNEYLRAFWEQAFVPFQARRCHLDLYHSPNYILPFALTGRCIVTVHDIIFRTAARFHTRRSSLYLSFCTAFAVRRAAHIIAVSDYTKEELLRVYPVARGKVTTIHQGLDPLFHQPTPSQDAVDRFREERGQGKPYILCVGTIEPRKNLVRLMAAFEKLASVVPHDLVVCGRRAWLSAPVLAAWERSPVKDRIKFAGFVRNEDLPYWYAGADVFVYPSLLEGFGLPPLEAMACGTPVVTSRTSALPEAVGDAALLVDPLSVDDLAAAIERLLTEPALADRLRERGLARARSFDWTETARKVMALYGTIVGGEQGKMQMFEQGAGS